MSFSRKIAVWDLPTRLFHWLLVLAFSAMVITGQLGGNLIEWHGRLGVLLCGLLAFRLVWGLVGSSYARFGQFFPTPGRIRSYLQGQWQGVGHNPLGALSVFSLLGLLSLQLLSGLVANDDIAFTGPLYALVSSDFSTSATGWHKWLANLLIGLVLLHVLAIAFYARVKKHNLLKPMITGQQEHPTAEPATGGHLPMLLLALTIGVLASVLASGIWLPEPPPPPAVQTPSW